MSGHKSNYGKRSSSNSDYPESDNKRRKSGGDEDSFSIGPEDTVYRYLCPKRKIGSIIGRGGKIIKKLRLDTKSMIRIGESVPGCEVRVVTIYSTNEETNDFEGSNHRVCPSQDALFKVHDRIVEDDHTPEDDSEESPQVTVQLLVPSDQIGCVIGKGGQIVKNIRSETGAQILIVKDKQLPTCALISDQLVKISGDAAVVRTALYQIAARLHDKPSKSQHLIPSSVPTASIMGFAPTGEASSNEFSLRLVCPTANIGGILGADGTKINEIMQESGAAINVHKAVAKGDNSVISITSKEIYEDTISPAIEAAILLQPRCSTYFRRLGTSLLTTKVLVPSSRIGCLIGEEDSIISEMREVTGADIRTLTKKHLPKLASGDEEVVQISGALDIAKAALVQVTSRLRANFFDKEGSTVLYIPKPAEPKQKPKKEPEELKFNPYDERKKSLAMNTGHTLYDDLIAVFPTNNCPQKPVAEVQLALCYFPSYYLYTKEKFVPLESNGLLIHGLFGGKTVVGEKDLKGKVDVSGLEWDEDVLKKVQDYAPVLETSPEGEDFFDRDADKVKKQAVVEIIRHVREIPFLDNDSYWKYAVDAYELLGLRKLMRYIFSEARQNNLLSPTDRNGWWAMTFRSFVRIAHSYPPIQTGGFELCFKVFRHPSGIYMREILIAMTGKKKAAQRVRHLVSFQDEMSSYDTLISFGDLVMFYQEDEYS